MPKDGKRGKKREGFISISDITLQDFADCPRPQSCGRLKKSVVCAQSTKVLAKTTVHKLEDGGDDLTWFEKDLDDFIIEEISREDEDLSLLETPLPSSGNSDKEATKKNSFADGKIYPSDIWYLISLHIQPGDIATFAGICKGSHSVTLRAAFWRALYHRVYIRGKECLPDHVKPHSMEKLHGLRARVICSFFYFHAPLAARVQGRGPMDDEPYCLKGHRCLLAWHQPAAKGWQFCFKFQKPSLQPLSSRPVSKLDVYHGYNDLFYNPEEGCSVLQVTCCHFASVAAVMGLLLHQVYVTLSAGFRHHRLRLHFDSHIVTSQNVPSDMVVVLNDVISIKLMQWWHPGYPFST